MSKENFNNYPDGFLEEFKEPVTFRLVDIKPDPDNKGAFLMPSVTSVPPQSSVIFTPEEGGDPVTVDLALISSFKDGNAVLDDRSMMLGKFNSGEIRLQPSIPKHRKIFNYINHCHHNKSSKYTFPGAKWIVEKVDPELIARKEREGTGNISAAVVAVHEASDAEIELLYNVIGEKYEENKKPSVSIMRSDLSKIALQYSSNVLDALKRLAINVESPLDPQDQDPLDNDKELEDVVSGLNGSQLVSMLFDKELVKQINPQKSFVLSQNSSVLFQWGDGEGSPKEKFAAAIDSNPDLKSQVEVAVA